VKDQPAEATTSDAATRAALHRVSPWHWVHRFFTTLAG
jgi:hypothetical protein